MAGNRNDRRAVILGAAVALARTDGYLNITRDRVAECAGVSMGLVNHHYGSMRDLRHAVMREAVSQRILEIVAQGLAYGNTIAHGAPLELRQDAAQYLIK